MEYLLRMSFNPPSAETGWIISSALAFLLAFGMSKIIKDFVKKEMYWCLVSQGLYEKYTPGALVFKDGYGARTKISTDGYFFEWIMYAMSMLRVSKATKNKGKWFDYENLEWKYSCRVRVICQKWFENVRLGGNILEDPCTSIYPPLNTSTPRKLYKPWQGKGYDR